MSTVLLALVTLMLPTAHAAEGDAKRGEYVAAVAGCATCHVTGMGPDAKQWAGGLKIFEGPPGTWVSPNITQHETTGIGKWTD
jgi:mono/diheme cytochrome c family protein